VSLLDTLAAIAVVIIWGVNIAVIKIGVAEFPPIFLAGFRFLLVAALLIWWVRPPWKQLRMIGLLSFAFGGLHFGGIFYGLGGVDVSIVAIFNLLSVPFAVLFARLILNDRFGWRKICGMGIAFVGMLILLGEPATTASPLHLVVVFMAVVAWGFGNTIIKLIGSVNVFALSAWMGLFASIQLLLTSAVLETGQLAALQNSSMAAWGSLLYTVFMASITGYGLWYYLVGKYDVSKVVPFTLLIPIVGVLAGVLIMGEVLTFEKIVGGLVTLCGVAIIQLRWQRPVKPANFPVEPTA
jgi:O-acetylserine/cysteine efflux transporter